jgi:hypothetical protein
MRNLTGKYTRKRSEKKADPRRDEPNQNLTSGSKSSGNLHDDLLARSEAYPDQTWYNRPGTTRTLGLILVIIAIITSIWFCFIGPGSADLESNLRRLAQQASLPASFTFTPSETSEPTQTISEVIRTITPSPSLEPATPTLLNTITPTGTATETVTPTTEPSPTPVPLQATSTPTSEVSGCVPASEITLADVGKTLCVSGRVVRTLDKPASFIIIVVDEPNAFFFVAYDLKYEQLDKKQCIYANGEIRQLGITPIMVVSYSVPIQYCP